jgi:putative PIN family toxin of toxin-antitoxin system
VRIVLDTNVLISALLVRTSPPALLIGLWRKGRFDLVTSAEQLDEVMRVTRYPKIQERLDPAAAGRLINDIRRLAIEVRDLPSITVSPDPADNYLLATAAAGAAQVLVTGDKGHLLALGSFQRTDILTVREFLERTGRRPGA